MESPFLEYITILITFKITILIMIILIFHLETMELIGIITTQNVEIEDININKTYKNNNY